MTGAYYKTMNWVGCRAQNRQEINLIVTCYFVEQIIPLGTSLETGSRIGFDIEIKF